MNWNHRGCRGSRQIQKCLQGIEIIITAYQKALILDLDENRSNMTYQNR